MSGPGPLFGPMLAVWEQSWDLFWRSRAVLGPLRAVLGALGVSTGVLGCTWAALGAYVGDLGPLLVLCSRSWAALGAAVCGPGPLLEPMLAVLGSSWVLSWRSCAALGAYVGALGPKNAKNMPTLKMCLFLERERDLQPGGRSWAALGAYVGGLGSLLEPMLAVLFAILASVGSGSAAVRRRDGPAGPEGWAGWAGPDRSEAQTQFFL